MRQKRDWDRHSWVTSLRRYFHQTRDRNFLGFKKRQKGPYQWKLFVPEKFVIDSNSWEFIASKIRPTDIVLDIGCGDGAYACTLAGRCKEIVGIDADWDGIHFAKQKKKEYRIKNAAFIQVPISQTREKLSEKAGRFDVVYAMDVIEHLPYPEELLGTISAMLAPDGIALIGTPLFVNQKLVSRFHVKEYTREEIHALISSHLDIQDETALPMKRKDDVMYEQGFYIGTAKRKPLGGEARRAASQNAPGENDAPRNLWQKVRVCVRERRMPYAYYLLKDFLRTSLKSVWVALWRRILPYQTEYVISKGCYNFFIKNKRSSPPPYNLVFVFKKQASGWILEGICREIARYFPGKTRTYFMDAREPLPPAKNYFFSHYSFLPECLKFHPTVWGGKIFVFHTHPKEVDAFKTMNYVYAFNQCEKVVCMNSRSVRSLQSQGVKPEKLAVVLGGADPHLFQPHERNGGAVGFSTAYYPRKSPDLILEIVRSMPHRKFVLLGPPGSDEGSRHRKWNCYKRFNELLSLKNFSYVEVPYSEYPKYYAGMDVFVSASKLEGGPIPLIETMMCNSVPVVSRTGFAPDIIRDGENGFLFDVESSAEEVAALIEKAYQLKADIRQTVEHLSWENCSLQIQRLLTP
ncbi:MAG: methyltransferase domain-containing protein [Candidatus Omnitrophica bacterium]|nr:methyltransferase domain-containing protein [Candidatus Omnitrophota bacterium]